MRLKSTALLCSILLAGSALAGGDFATAIIRPTGTPLVLTIPENRVVRVVNFIQDVVLFDGTPGQVLVSKDSSDPIAVMTASAATQSEVQKDLTVRGPATITVKPVTGASLFLTVHWQGD